MIKYNPKEDESYLLSSNNTERFSRRSFEDFVSNVTINVVLAPIALFVLVMLLGGLAVLAFGKNSDWGMFPKMLVAVGVPALVISAVTNVRVGNTIFILWYCLFWGVLAIGFFGTIIYAAFTNYFDLF